MITLTLSDVDTLTRIRRFLECVETQEGKKLVKAYNELVDEFLEETNNDSGTIAISIVKELEWSEDKEATPEVPFAHRVATTLAGDYIISWNTTAAEEFVFVEGPDGFSEGMATREAALSRANEHYAAIIKEGICKGTPTTQSNPTTVVVPDGWRLVPVVLTEAMNEEFKWVSLDLQTAYSNILSAAPKYEHSVQVDTNNLYKFGEYVKKKSGSQWHGRVCGFYSTEQTPIGYCIESSYERDSVQIYPEKALVSWDRTND